MTIARRPAGRAPWGLAVGTRRSTDRQREGGDVPVKDEDKVTLELIDAEIHAAEAEKKEAAKKVRKFKRLRTSAQELATLGSKKK